MGGGRAQTLARWKILHERADMLLRMSLVIGLVLVNACVARGNQADTGEHRVAVRTVSGRISAVAWSKHRFTIAVANGPVTLAVDRNTAVFLDDRLGSLGDLVVGMPVRASFGGDERAVWVEVLSPDISSADGGRQDGGGPPPTPPDAGAWGSPEPRESRRGAGSGGRSPYIRFAEGTTGTSVTVAAPGPTPDAGEGATAAVADAGASFPRPCSARKRRILAAGATNVSPGIGTSKA